MNENLAEKFLPLSAYLAPPDDIQPALDKDMRADVAIIGGGWTGLSAALKLRQQGMQVALLEQQHCGYGASGRSGGHLVGPGKESRIFFAKPNAAKSKQYTDYISRIVAIAE